jgi:hypothetical protein
MILKNTQISKKGDNLENKILSITNIFKGCKITDLTRPNELDTTTNKVSMRSPERTRLWKWLRTPSCYAAEHTLLDHTIFFKGKTQCIQDWCQWHSMTTWTRWGLQASVYPSTMWCWIKCRSAPDSHEIECKDQPGAARWGNTSRITRLLPPTSTYYLVQCRSEISPPLIPITRLLPSTTSNTRLLTHAGGLLYLTNYHIHGRKTTSSTPRLCRFAAARQGVFIGQGAVYMEQMH